MSKQILNIEWAKCHHGIEKRSLLPCEKCRQEKQDFENMVFNPNREKKTRVPILRGCKNKECFCTGACKEVIGWRDALPHEIDNQAPTLSRNILDEAGLWVNKKPD